MIVITQVNDKVVKNKADIIAEIEKCRNLHYKEIKVMFSTIETGHTPTAWSAADLP